MIRPVDSKEQGDETPKAEITFEIEPQRAPYFQLLQPIDDRWVEVGWVWTAGLSRTNAIENWYLYETTSEGDRERLPYFWPGYDSSGTQRGTTLRLVPAKVPPNLNTGELKTYLERTLNVTITHVKAAIGAGR